MNAALPRGLVGALALLALTREAEGALRLQAPAGCGTAEEFEAEVRRRLGDARVLERTEVSIEPEGLEHRLRVRIGTEERAVRDVDCRDLFRAAVVVTVAIALSEQDPDRAESPQAGVAPEPRARSLDVGQKEARGGGPALGASAGGLVSFGVLPKPALGLELEARADWKRFGVALGGHGLFPVQDVNADGRGVRVRAWGGHVSGILHLTPWLEGRVGFVVHRLLGEGRGSSLRDTHAATWAAGPTLALALTPLKGEIGWLSLSGEGYLDLVRSEFEILNYGPVYSVPNFGAAIYLRAGLRFF